jgi:hypothetical protein
MNLTASDICTYYQNDLVYRVFTPICYFGGGLSGKGALMEILKVLYTIPIAKKDFSLTL